MADDKSPGVIAVAIIFLFLTVTTVAIRIYVRAYMIRAMESEDWTMLGAFLMFLAYTVCQIGAVRYGTGRHIEDLEREDAQRALQNWWLCEVFFAPATTLLKVSVGLFLLRITEAKWQIWTIRLFIPGSVIFGAFYTFLVVFQCRPTSLWWNLDPDAPGSCINAEAFATCTFILSVLNTTADLTFAILPQFIVKSTKMNAKTRALVFVLLSLGSIAVIATVIRFPYLHTLNHYKGDFLYATTEVAILTTVEVGLGITVACAATFRPLFQRWVGSGSPSGDSSARERPGHQSQPLRMHDLGERNAVSERHILKTTTLITSVSRGNGRVGSPEQSLRSDSREDLTWLSEAREEGGSSP